MKTPITTGTFIALGLSVVLGYAAPQQSQPAQPQRSPRPTTGAPPGAASPGVGSQRNERLQTTTLTGCLRQGASARTYVLEQSPGSSVPNGGIGTAGGRDPRGNRYDMVIDSKTDASKMVGRQVQVMGMETITPTTGIGGGTGERERSPGDAGLTRFTVKSLKETGSGC